MTRHASCLCGQLRLACEGEPVRLSICHCLDCQKRTGSAFGIQARFPPEQVTIEGEAREWVRTGDSGRTATFGACPVCASTVYWTNEGYDLIAVAVGAFADPNFPAPQISVYENRKHPWVGLPDGLVRE